MSACEQCCVHIADIALTFLSYLEVPDLLACKLVCLSWHTWAVRSLLHLASSCPHYSCFTYLIHGDDDDVASGSSNSGNVSGITTSSKVFRIQEQISRIYHRRQQRHGSMLLFGGAFGGFSCKMAYIDDFHAELCGNVVTNVTEYFPGDKLGAVASFYDPNMKEVVVLGGWDEDSNQSLSRVMTLSVGNLKPTNEMTSEDSQEIGLESVPQKAWKRHSNLPEDICYGAATLTLNGDILHIGGGNTPFRGARVFDHSYFYSKERQEWEANVIGKMNVVRCGHSALTLMDGKVVVLGGYGGEMLYYDSVEMYDFEKQTWYMLPSMKYRRSGLAAVIGPSGSIYVAGGSENGEIGQRSLERFDPREGKWYSLAAMQRRRGYVTGAISSSMNFYVNGGLHNYRLQGGMERYDFRQNTWETMIGSSHCVLENPQFLNFADFPVENIPSSGILPQHAFPDEELIRAGHQLHFIY